MNRERKIEGIYHGAGFHWVGNGFRVTNYFPSNERLAQKISPYVLFDYHPPFHYAPTDSEQRGVGAHPHRGFETVTLAFEGSVAHHDSAGNAGVIGPGDVQWMTAASGILHKEYHEREFARAGGSMHMAQIWVNLPKAHKMDAPRYQSIAASQIGLVHLPDSAGQVRVIAGEYEGVRGPAMTFSPINVFDIRLNPEGRVHLSFPARENTALMSLMGDVTLNGETGAAALDFVLFENEGADITVEAPSGAHLLLLNGEPIDEPVVQSGPFVMNTEREIRQAMMDFRNGKFGRLE
ncbi:MAG: pirin family protein [Acidobacteriota bacterium]|nr:pirin family protein [Acidobacteriota bacterium]